MLWSCQGIVESLNFFFFEVSFIWPCALGHWNDRSVTWQTPRRRPNWMLLKTSQRRRHWESGWESGEGNYWNWNIQFVAVWMNIIFFPQCKQDNDSFAELGGVAGWWSGDDVWLGRLCQGVISRIFESPRVEVSWSIPCLSRRESTWKTCQSWFRPLMTRKSGVRVVFSYIKHYKARFFKQSSWRFTTPPTGPTRSPTTAKDPSWGSWSGKISPQALRRRWFVAAMSRCVSWRRDPPQIFSALGGGDWQWVEKRGKKGTPFFGRYFLDVHSGHGVRKWWL